MRYLYPLVLACLMAPSFACDKATTSRATPEAKAPRVATPAVASPSVAKSQPPSVSPAPVLQAPPKASPKPANAPKAAKPPSTPAAKTVGEVDALGCARVCAHVVELALAQLKTVKERALLKQPSLDDCNTQCRARATKAEVACMAAAKTLSDLGGCYK